MEKLAKQRITATVLYMNKSAFLLLGSLIVTTYLKSQPVFDQAKIKADYKGYSLLVLNSEQTVTCEVVKNKLEINADFLQQVMYLDNNSTSANESRVSFAPEFFVIDKLEANTYVEEDGKYKKIKVTSFKDEGNIDGSAFYDGVKYRKFYFPGLTENSVTETKYTYHYVDPSCMGAFYFRRGVPVLKSCYSVIASNDVTIDYKFFGDTSQITYSKTVKGGKTTHRWELLNGKELKDYDDAVDDRYNEPHIYVYVKEYKTSGNKNTPYFGTVQNLYQHDFKYIEKLNKQPVSDDLKAVVDSIKMTYPNNEKAIIKATYYWVQQNMKYIAFEDGLGGQIPREANDVFHKKYGDCKDFASLITFMLNVAGIKSYMAWVGTRSLPYSYNDLPLGYASNHMIAAVRENNEWIFIDGTAKHIPYGVPSSGIQGKEAMISISPDSFVVERIKTMPPQFNYSNSIINLKIEDTKLIGTAQLDLYGYNHSSWSEALYYSGTNKAEKNFKKLLSLGNNKFEITKLDYSHLFNNDSPLVINYSFNLPEYLKQIEKDIYINLHLNKSYLRDKIDTSDNRSIAKYYPYTWLEEGVTILEIPQGYEVKKLPTNSVVKGSYLNYSFTYEVKGNQVILHQSSSYDKLSVAPEDFIQWNKNIDELFKRYKDLIILTKKVK